MSQEGARGAPGEFLEITQTPSYSVIFSVFQGIGVTMEEVMLVRAHLVSI